MCEIIYLILSIFLGGLTGYVELLNRYSKPNFIFRCFAGVAYIVLNAIIAIVALFILARIKQYGIDLDKLSIVEVIIAGTSAMAILRSSFLNYQYKDKKINIGLAIIPQIFMEVLDKAYDIALAREKLEKIPEIMKSVDFEKAKIELPALCINSRETMSDGEMKVLNEELSALSNSNCFSNTNKSIQLGQILSKYFGDELLQQVVKILNKDVTNEQVESTKDRLDYWEKEIASKK